MPQLMLLSIRARSVDRGSNVNNVSRDSRPAFGASRPAAGERQWQEPLPESVNVFPAIGTNCQL